MDARQELKRQITELERQIAREQEALNRLHTAYACLDSDSDDPPSVPQQTVRRGRRTAASLPQRKLRRRGGKLSILAAALQAIGNSTKVVPLDTMLPTVRQLTGRQDLSRKALADVLSREASKEQALVHGAAHEGYGKSEEVNNF